MQVPLSQKPCPEQKSESRAWSTPTELFRLQEPVRSGDRAAAQERSAKWRGSGMQGCARREQSADVQPTSHTHFPWSLQVPCCEQPRGQVRWEHVSPVQPGSHLHLPPRVQIPRALQSALPLQSSTAETSTQQERYHQRLRVEGNKNMRGTSRAVITGKAVDTNALIQAPLTGHALALARARERWLTCAERVTWASVE